MSDEGWVKITHAYDIAGFNFQPVALRIVSEAHHVVHTGLLVRTEDVYQDGITTPTSSIFYLEGGGPIEIRWSQVVAVLAMPGIAPTEGENNG